jgi:hypothetical protein
VTTIPGWLGDRGRGRPIPLVTDPDQARREPELTVLSALAHGRNPKRRRPVLDALVGALATVDPDRGRIYNDVVRAALPKAAQRYLERIMSIGNYQFKSDWALRHINEGRAEAVLTVLADSGIEVPDDARDRIATCTDADEVNTWLRHAITAETIDEVFAE